MKILNKTKKHLMLAFLVATFDILLLCQLLFIIYCVWLGMNGAAGAAVTLIFFGEVIFSALGTGAIYGYKKFNKKEKII